jgi:hypothetical protein
LPVDLGMTASAVGAREPDRRSTSYGCCVRKIKDVADYATYLRIVEGCRLAARELGCLLIEVEQLWSGSATPRGGPRTDEKEE